MGRMGVEMQGIRLRMRGIGVEMCGISVEIGECGESGMGFGE